MNGDYTVAIWATVGLTVLFTVPVVWQFLQPNDDDFGDHQTPQVGLLQAFELELINPNRCPEIAQPL